MFFIYLFIWIYPTHQDHLLRIDNDYGTYMYYFSDKYE